MSAVNKKRLIDAIYQNHGIKVSEDDPLLVMVTIHELMVRDELETLKAAQNLVNEQAKKQLTVEQIRILQSMVMRKHKPNYMGFLLGVFSSIIMLMVILLSLKFWYEPAKIGNKILKAYPDLDKTSQTMIRNIISK